MDEHALRKLLSMSAGDLVNALIDAGLSFRDIESSTKINRGALSRIANGKRGAGETRWRAVARFAIERGIFNGVAK